MTSNCIHIFIVTSSFLYWSFLRPAPSVSSYSCIYLRISIISYSATFLGTDSLSVLMCRKAVTQLINQSIALSVEVALFESAAVRDRSEYRLVCCSSALLSVEGIDVCCWNRCLVVELATQLYYVAWGLLHTGSFYFKQNLLGLLLSFTLARL